MRLNSPVSCLCALAVVLFSALPPAWATPPRWVAVEDVLFGVNATHLFLLRSVSDNLETHMTELTDIVLVAKAIEDGAEETIWPVRRILAAGDIFTIEPSQRVKDVTLSGRVDPFDILAERKAEPLQDSTARVAGNANLQNWFTERAFALGKWQGTAEYVMPLEALAAQMTASLRATRDALPPFEDGYDPLTDSSFADLAKCEVSRLYLTRPAPEGPSRAFAKLKCFDVDNVLWSWLYVAVPAVD